MKEKNRAEEWFRAKHDELAGTARANLAAHDLEPDRRPTIWTASTMRPPNRWRHMPDGHRLRPVRDSGERQRRIRRGDAHWDDAAWWDEQARAMWDEVDGIPDDGFYWTSVEDETSSSFPAE